MQKSGLWPWLSAEFLPFPFCPLALLISRGPCNIRAQLAASSIRLCKPGQDVIGAGSEGLRDVWEVQIRKMVSCMHALVCVSSLVHYNHQLQANIALCTDAYKGTSLG